MGEQQDPSRVSAPSRAQLMVEFAKALEDEVDEATRQSARAAVPLNGGRLIAKIGGSCQYLFTAETAFSLPGDTPADLIVPGRPHLEATVVSAEGLTVIVSVQTDLGGFVPNARLRSNLTYLLRLLTSRLEELAVGPNPAGDRLLGLVPASGAPAPLPPTDNAEQDEAVSSAIGRDLTFLWGPPGTGKTTTIGRLASELFRRDRSVLIVSHTNTAVDQALLNVGTLLSSALESGKIIRLGDPVQQELKEVPLLLAATHVERRAEQLTQERAQLVRDREDAKEHVLRVSHSIDLCEWVVVAARDLETLEGQLTELTAIDGVKRDAETEVQVLQRNEAAAREQAQAARIVLDLQVQLQRALELRGEHEKAHAIAVLRLQGASSDLQAARTILVVARELAPLRKRASSLPSVDLLEATLATHGAALVAATGTLQEKEAGLREAESLLREAAGTGLLLRTWRGLRDPQVLASELETKRTEAAGCVSAVTTLEQTIAAAKDQLQEAKKIRNGLAPHADIPTEAEQEQRVLRREREASAATWAERTAKEALAGIEDRCNQLAKMQDEAQTKCQGSPEYAIEQHELARTALESAKASLQSATLKYDQHYTTVRKRLGQQLGALRQMHLTSRSFEGVAASYLTVRSTVREAEARVASLNVAALRHEREELNAHIRASDDAIARIDQQLTHVEDVIVSEASIVATTLTRAYMRESLKTRRFDTVVLDEASMAPLPALWAAAALATTNVVVVGDFRQLSPIVLAQTEVAKRWLGRDIFEVSGAKAAYEAGRPLNCFVELKRQFRMHPAIAAIPNSLFYDGQLRSDDDCGDRELNGWYNRDWGPDAPVVLLDTKAAGAWVTSVARGWKSSRLNFLSATFCCSLAERLLLPGRSAPANSSRPRILVVSPYRPHAKLVQQILEEAGLAEEVRSGTAHSFQGSEASVVIVDLVNDQPHWRVGMFVPTLDDGTRRLLNVAITRARRRLFIVGNLGYCQAQSRKAFLGREFIPRLQTGHPAIDVLSVLPGNLTARFARLQFQAVGGLEELGEKRAVVTQDDFFRMLEPDLRVARERVVIYSPFLAYERLSRMMPQLRTLTDGGVRVFVVTKPLSERGVRERSAYRYLEELLSMSSVGIVHKAAMHEKFVFVDDEIVWSGSLNPLSHSSTQEVMERRVSRTICEEFAKVLRLNDLLGPVVSGETRCPVCESGLIAAEGRDDPFYWRCEADAACYSRGIDDPPLENGELRCRRCQGEVRLGEWGEVFVWRCQANPRHHQAVRQSHLRLPRMRERLSPKELRLLESSFAKRPRGRGVAQTLE